MNSLGISVVRGRHDPSLFALPMLIMVRGIVVASLLLGHSSAHSFNVSSPEALVTYLKSFPSFFGFGFFFSEELDFKNVFRIQVDWGSDRM